MRHTRHLPLLLRPSHSRWRFRFGGGCVEYENYACVLAFPGSSYGWFSIPSKAMNKGNGKNLATQIHTYTTQTPYITTARLPDCRSASVGDSRLRNYKTTATAAETMCNSHASIAPV